MPRSSATDDTLNDLGLTAAYDYELPESLIATTPSPSRTESRLMVLLPSAKPRDATFADLPGFLRSGDLLVRNTSRVLPARLLGHKQTGGRVELLALKPVGRGWEDPGPTRFSALGKASKPIRAGARLTLDDGAELDVCARLADGTLEVQTHSDDSLRVWLEAHGSMPLPPYITQARSRRCEDAVAALDRERYQTVYADTPGAVAAPTAGLHFNQPLFDRLSQHDIEVVDIQLDVGVGTFRPISSERLADHDLHEERYVVPTDSAERINAALADRRRIVAVGTTVFRTLEDQAARSGQAIPGIYTTRLFVRPGYPIRWIDGLVTNFHLPRSSLLALVTAFGGYRRIRRAYERAIDARYRFYSYGDAMLIFPDEAAP